MSLARKAILAAATNPALTRLVRAHGMRLGASRFVAGETLQEALDACRVVERQAQIAWLLRS